MPSLALQMADIDDQVELLSRDRILAEALPLFATQGYGGVTMREIARAASLTIGTLYHYFDSKRALYLAVLDWAYGRAATHWATEILHGPDNPRERLKTYVREYCAFVAANHDFVRLIKREQLEGDADQMELQANALLAQQYQATVELFGEIAPDRDPTLLAHSLIGLVVHHYETRALRRFFADYQSQHDDPAYVSEHILRLLDIGLTAPQAQIDAPLSHSSKENSS